MILGIVIGHGACVDRQVTVVRVNAASSTRCCIPLDLRAKDRHLTLVVVETPTATRRRIACDDTIAHE